MKQRRGLQKKVVEPQILALYLGAALIVLAGIGLTMYSITSQMHYLVMGNEVHGAIFGSIIAFLGIRYFFGVVNLNRQIIAAGGKFSWANLFSQKANH